MPKEQKKKIPRDEEYLLDEEDEDMESKWDDEDEDAGLV